MFRGRPRHEIASWSFLAHHANMFFRHRLDCTQHAAEDAQRNFATHSFNDMEHPSSSTATRVEKSAATLAVSGGGLSADARRDCTISTPTMNDTRIKVEHVHVEKESDGNAVPIRDRTPLRSKKKKKSRIETYCRRVCLLRVLEAPLESLISTFTLPVRGRNSVVAETAWWSEAHVDKVTSLTD